MSMDALQEKIRTYKCPLALGLEPSLEDIPPQLLETMTPAGIAQALETYCVGILEAVAELIPAVKLRQASFEAYGAPGLAALQRIAAKASELDYYVILDIGRSEDQEVSSLLARAYFGAEAWSPFDCDAVTVNGYLGTDAILPWVQAARERSRGLFLLSRTANRSGRQVQDLLSGDRVVHTAMLDLGLRAAGDDYEELTWSRVGAVISPGWGVDLAQMRAKYSRTFFLLPEFGGQGATAQILSDAFDRFGHGAIIHTPKGISAAWRKREDDGSQYQALALEAAQKMKKELTRALFIC